MEQKHTFKLDNGNQVTVWSDYSSDNTFSFIADQSDSKSVEELLDRLKVKGLKIYGEHDVPRIKDLLEPTKPTHAHMETYCQELISKFKQDPKWELQQEFGKMLMRPITSFTEQERSRYEELKELLKIPEPIKLTPAQVSAFKGKGQEIIKHEPDQVDITTRIKNLPKQDQDTKENDDITTRIYNLPKQGSDFYPEVKVGRRLRKDQL